MVGANGILATAAGTGNCATTVPTTFGPSIDLPPVYALAVDSQDKIFAIFASGLYSLADGAISEINGLNQIQAIAIDSKDRLCAVGFGGGGPARVDPDGSVEFLNWIPQGIPLGLEWLTSPTIAIDDSDNVYLLNWYQATGGIQHLVYRFTPEGVGSPNAILDFPDLRFAVDSLGGIWYVSFFNLEHVDSSSVPVGMSGRCCGYSGDGGALVGAAFDLGASASAVSSPSGDIYLLDDGNAVIRKISGTPPANAPAISPGGIVSAAGLLGGAIAPGELISIFGSNFLAAGLQINSPDNNLFPTTLSNLRVFFTGSNERGGQGAITAATPNQINVFAPYEIAGSTSVTISVSADYVGSSSVTLPVAQSAFALFTDDGSGSNQGAILNQDGSYNSDKNPAAAGSIVVLYGSGEGATTPALPDGALVISTPYSIPNQPVTVTIADQPAHVLYAGAAPFLATGVLQINARVPAGVTGDAPIVVSVGGISTSRKVTVAAK